jgi:hypothetical protein
MEKAVERHEAQLTAGFSISERDKLLELLWRVALPS